MRLEKRRMKILTLTLMPWSLELKTQLTKSKVVNVPELQEKTPMTGVNLVDAVEMAKSQFQKKSLALTQRLTQPTIPKLKTQRTMMTLPMPRRSAPRRTPAH